MAPGSTGQAMSTALETTNSHNRCILELSVVAPLPPAPTSHPFWPSPCPPPQAAPEFDPWMEEKLFPHQHSPGAQGDSTLQQVGRGAVAAGAGDTPRPELPATFTAGPWGPEEVLATNWISHLQVEGVKSREGSWRMYQPRPGVGPAAGVPGGWAGAGPAWNWGWGLGSTEPFSHLTADPTWGGGVGVGGHHPPQRGWPRLLAVQPIPAPPCPLAVGT